MEWLLLVLAALLLVLWAGLSVAVRRRSVARLFVAAGEDEETPEPDPDVAEQAALRRWLFRAGFRSPSAPATFVLGTVLALLVGLGLVAGLRAAGLHAGAPWLGAVPEEFAVLLGLVLAALPPAVVVAVTAVPLLFVRAVRRQRVEAVEQDLPVALEVLATLGEAGLGFDTSVARLLSSSDPRRPLTQELQTWRLEGLAGIPRVRCLRRLERRADVVPLTLVASALVQAEQTGAGTAAVLRRQADELRAMRRDHALARAQALPVKLVFPLVVCFLPGIVVATLLPIFVQFLLRT